MLNLRDSNSCLFLEIVNQSNFSVSFPNFIETSPGTQQTISIAPPHVAHLQPASQKILKHCDIFGIILCHSPSNNCSICRRESIYLSTYLPTYLSIYLSIYIHTGWWFQLSTPLKNMSQLGLLFSIYGKVIQMFQTTNQHMSYTYIYTYIHTNCGISTSY